MQPKYSLSYAFFFLLILLLFITFPSICINGASRGLLLWFNKVLPTLFPFFLITRLILAYNIIPRKIIGLYPILTGLIAGYPTGAMTLHELIKENKINIPTAQILLIICNNASPGFLIGMTSAICPGNKYRIWFCTIISSVIISMMYFLYRKIFFKERYYNKKTSVYSNRCLCISDKSSISFVSTLETTILQCFKTLVVIGGYIIIFSILSDYLSVILSDTDILTKGIVAGICEITTGVTYISSNTPHISSFNTASFHASSSCISMTATAFLCSFGGICALMQTAGVLEGSGISIKKYVVHKLLCGIAAGLCMLLFYML